MKFIFILSLSIFIAQVFAGEKKSKEILGVLVQLESESSKKTPDFDKLKKRYKLDEKKYFPSMQTLSLALKEATSDEEELLRFCVEIKKLPSVKHCELDYVLKGQCEDDSLPCTPPRKPVVVLSKELNDLSEKMRCEIVPHSPVVVETEGLSPFWAQEYTGADLVREKLKSIHPPLKIPPNLVGIWDSGDEDHGTMVGHLIMGPNASAIIPSKNIVPYNNLEKIVSTSDYIRAYESFTQKCSTQKNCPLYINNSMIWEDSALIEKAIEKISKTTVFVTSAGNIPSMMEEVKRKASAKTTALTVASLKPNGLASNFTGFASEVTISAPSDYSLMSFDKKSKPFKFGGTSGAAPQVTSALAAFTLITGHALSSAEAKKLLEKTALKIPHYPLQNGLGAGVLNSYKLAEVAFKLAKQCEKEGANKSKCVSQKLQDNESYLFATDSKDVIKVANKVFPECFSSKNSEDYKPTCDERKKIFKELRKTALLNQSDPALWESIACISQFDGMNKNAEFYNSLAKREKTDEEQLVKELIINHSKYSSTNSGLFEFILSKPEWMNHPKMIGEIVQSEGVDWEIPEYLLKHPQWIEHPELISKIVQGEKNNRGLIIFTLSQPGWSKHPELVSHLIKTNSDKDWDNFLVEYVLSKPEWGKRPDLISKLIDKGMADSIIAEKVLSQPAWKNQTELIAKLIQKNNANLSLARHVFSQLHMSDQPELLKKFIQSGSSNTTSIAEYVLSKPQWKNHPEFVRMLIDKTGMDKFAIAKYALSQPHWSEHPELVEYLIQRGYGEDVDEYILTQNFWKEIFRKRLGIQNVTAAEIKRKLSNN